MSPLRRASRPNSSARWSLLSVLLPAAVLALTACGPAASSGTPDAGPSCTDACASNGAVQCVGNSVEQCAPAASGCLAWSAPVACSANQACQNGVCSAAAAVDPTGNWNTTVTFGAGTCGAAGQAGPWTFTVTTTTTGYAMSSSDPNQTISGTLTCTADGCQLSAQAVGTGSYNDGTAYNEDDAFNLTLKPDKTISGTGTANVTPAPDGSDSCTQAVTVAGTKS